MFENKVTWRCGRENSPSGFPAQWTPRQDGTNLKDEPGVGIQKGLKRVFVSPSRVTYKWLCQLQGVTDSGRKPSQWLESRSEHEKQNTNACREDTAAEEQGMLHWCRDAQLWGEGRGGVQGGLPGDQKGVRHPGLSPQQGVLIQLPKGAIPVRKVLWSTSAQTKLIVYHEKAAVITGFEIHQNNPLRSYRWYMSSVSVC